MSSPIFRARRRLQTTRSPIFTIAPWRPEDGDSRHPRELFGVAVDELIRVRADASGALVALVDGRYAITGRVLVVGNARQLKRYARLQLGRSDSEPERGWLGEVRVELARRAPRPLGPVRAQGLGPVRRRTRTRRLMAPNRDNLRALPREPRTNGQVLRIPRAPGRQQRPRPSPDDLA